ncbi:hypothetical protein GCM10022377_20920 [Zhihengliuella alba]|uniref:Uncharacterized protein n=1 Tax=Zhihengliuella alba TaxID=547018 RepID=A0ABP7DKM8_9MICC
MLPRGSRSSSGRPDAGRLRADSREARWEALVFLLVMVLVLSLAGVVAGRLSGRGASWGCVVKSAFRWVPSGGCGAMGSTAVGSTAMGSTAVEFAGWEMRWGLVGHKKMSRHRLMPAHYDPACCSQVT